MKCAKSIDELYQEVREYDLVITVDAALATALNARIDKPIIGSFALTPKQIASQVFSRLIGSEPYSELKVISTVSEETGLSLKYVHSEIENIKEIRKYTKDVTKHLHSESSRAVYDSYEPIKTLERLMGFFIPEDDEFFNGLSIAVIEEELFNDLDKHFIPIDHTPISIFKKEDFEIERIYEIGNDRQLAENAVDLIDPSKCTDYALVLNTASPIADSVRAALYRKRLPFINSLNVRDLSQIRDYLQFITLAMDFQTIRVKHVKELFSNYNGFFKKGREEFLLSKQTPEDMRSNCQHIWQIMHDIRGLTFGQVAEELCDRRAKIQVGILIEDLGVKDSVITPYLLNEVKYAVDNVKELHHNEEIPEDEKKGVLLVDCNNSVYIDRPVVIYLGMEQDWNRPLAGKPYIDIEDETDKNVSKLQALIQQGSVRFYCVNSTKGGKPARPCMLFDLIYRRPVESFRLMCSELVQGRWHEEQIQVIPDTEKVVEPDSDSFDVPFSKSTFNAYYSCPRKFLYGSLLKIPDEKTTEFGTLVHSFAEFYVCYPEDVRSLGIDRFVDMVADRFSGLSSPLMADIDKGRIRKAMSAIIEFIDYLGVRDAPLDRTIDRDHPNIFMEALGKERSSSICEVDLSSSKYPIHGKMDLLWEGAITDYKTGGAHDSDSIAKAMSIGSGVKYPEFQPLIYLQLISERADSRDIFHQFYAMENDVSSETEDVHIMSNVRTMKLSKENTKDALTGSQVLCDELNQSLSKDLRPNAGTILRVISEMAGDDPSVWHMDEGLVNAILDAIGKSVCKTNILTVQRGLKKIAGYAKWGAITVGNSLEIPSDFITSTMEKVDELHSAMVAQSRQEFPAMPRIACRDCQFFPVCTKEKMILDGDGDE